MAFNWMMANVIASSFFPLLVLLGGANTYPYFFTAFDNLIASAVILLILIIAERRIISLPAIGVIFSPKKSRMKTNLCLLPCILRGIATTPAFLLATKYIDIIAVIIIYETWPIIKILIMDRLFKSTNQYHPITFKLIALFGLSLLGVAIVIIGQSATQIDAMRLQEGTITGVALALLAAVLTALAPSFSLKHGAIVGLNLSKETGVGYNLLYCSMISIFIQRTISGIIALVVAIALYEQMAWAGAITVVVAGILTAIASIGIRKANLITHNLGVNALRYLNPILAIIWLFVFTTTHYGNITYLIIGISFIIISNLSINYKKQPTQEMDL